MRFWVRGNFLLFFILAGFLAAAIFAQQPPPPAQSNQPQTPTTSPASPQVAPTPPALVTSAPHIGLTTVVVDAAHGGTDSGARGASGINEKDVTLVLARAVKSQLEARGLRVVLTREGDQNPSLDDRAAIANARSGAVFVSLHVGSTGAAGTARVYYFTGPATSPAADAEKSAWVRWDEAQYRFTEQSAQLAGIVQVQIGLKLRGSPEVAVGAAVRQLRAIHAPAIAVELSSVGVADRKILEAAMEPLGEAIARGALAFQPVFAAGGR